jgi:antitoxin (DNA-binding transcriptional repressor) of toxin-antitoxin stability system
MGKAKRKTETASCYSMSVSAVEFNAQRSTLLQKMRLGLCREVAITYRGKVVAKMTACPTPPEKK